MYFNDSAEPDAWVAGVRWRPLRLRGFCIWGEEKKKMERNVHIVFFVIKNEIQCDPPQSLSGNIKQKAFGESFVFMRSARVAGIYTKRFKEARKDVDGDKRTGEKFLRRFSIAVAYS